MTGRRFSAHAAVWPFCLLLVLGAPDVLRGHARTVSYSTWTATPGGWDVQVRLPLLELDRRFGKGQWSTDTARSFSLEHFRARTGQGPCSVEGWSGEKKTDVFLARWTLRCPGPVHSFSLDSFFGTAPSHLHLARVHDGGKGLEQVVTAAAPVLSLDRPEPEGFVGLFFSGAARFLARPAHLFCLAGLVLLAVSRRSFMKILAAFVLGCTVSMVPVCLGLVRTVPRSVGSLTGLIVFLAAVELFIRCSPPGQCRRWRLALAAGLLVTSLLSLWDGFPVSTLALSGVALISLSFLGLGGPDSTASIPWLLAGGAGLILGMGAAGTPEAIGQGGVAGFSRDGIPAVVLGAVSAAGLAASGMYIVFSRLVPRGERDVLRKRGLQEPLAASILMAAGTYWFVERALETF